MSERKRLEQDGLFVDAPDHWEMWETTLRGYRAIGNNFTHVVTIPADIRRHLKLKIKQKVMIAIKVLPDE